MHLTLFTPILLAFFAAAQRVPQGQLFQPTESIQPSSSGALCIAFTQPNTDGDAKAVVNDGKCVVFDVKPNIVRSVMVGLGAHLELFADYDCGVPFGRYSIDQADIGIVNSMRCSYVQGDL